ncbi:hypothetical protein [Salinicoccus roseus]|uniref:hypothetical protein n=1 Tax=Salinicoccus roseus TaxID=45670 RepID=UPI003DA0976F
MLKIWKVLRKKEEEKDWWDKSCIDRWIARAQSNGVDIPKEVAEQWLFCFIDQYDFIRDYVDIDLTKVTFKLVGWSTESILDIKPGELGHKGRFLPVIRDLKKIKGDINKSSYSHIESIKNSWVENGTWETPPIVLDSCHFPGFKSPYELVEGYTRLAWFNYYANSEDNISNVKLSSKHEVWLMTLND